MATVELTASNFEPTVSKAGIVLVDFWAPWCGPCKSFGPVFESASQIHPEATFAKVNTEEERQLGGMLQIRSIPTLMIFRDGIPIFRQAGALPGHALEDLIGQVHALDMTAVRAEYEAALKNTKTPSQAQA